MGQRRAWRILRLLACMLVSAFSILCMGASTLDAFADEEPTAIEAQASSASVTSPVIRGTYTDAVPARSIHDENETASDTGRCDNNRSPKASDATALRPQAGNELPRSYSAVDQGHVTPVRNQTFFGTCWAFATIAAVESSLLATGQASADTLDLSERHLAYFCYHSAEDPLGYANGDTVKPGDAAYGGPADASDAYLFVGGNPNMAMHALASKRGAALEESAPYDALDEAYLRYEESLWAAEQTQTEGEIPDIYSFDDFLADTALDPAAAYESNAFEVVNAYEIDLRDTEDVKNAIMNHGGVAVLMYFDEQYYNYEKSAYYYYGSYDTNHAITIVGWDDDYDASNFATDYSWYEEQGIDVSDFRNKTKAPADNGAWLVKNSYGPESDDAGYFWMSYSDRCAGGTYSKGYVYDAQPAGAYDHVYQHDGGLAACWNYVKSGGSIASVFTASGNPDGAETLDAVSIALDDVNVDYSVQIYLNPTDPSNPESGSPALAEPATGKTSKAGFYTIDLPTPVPLKPQTTYAVVATLAHQNNASVKYSVDADYTRWDWVKFKSSVSAGQSFEKDTSDASWDDLSASTSDASVYAKCAARVKALTRNIPTDELPTISLEAGSLEIADGPFVHNGQPLTPNVTVHLGGGTLQAGIDYLVEYANNVDVGTGTVTVTGMGNFTGTITGDFDIVSEITPDATPDGETIAERADNPLLVKAKTKTLKAYKLKQRKRSVKGAIIVKRKGKGTITYTKLSKGSSKWLTVAKRTGKITVKKNTKRGTYKIRIKVRASGNACYKPKTQIVTCIIRVK